MWLRTSLHTQRLLIPNDWMQFRVFDSCKINATHTKAAHRLICIKTPPNHQRQSILQRTLLNERLNQFCITLISIWSRLILMDFTLKWIVHDIPFRKISLLFFGTRHTYSMIWFLIQVKYLQQPKHFHHSRWTPVNRAKTQLSTIWMESALPLI